MIKKNIKVKSLDAIVFDFDGVMTDDHVYISEEGKELVRCYRGDGLAIDALRNLGTRLFIISTETNKVVKQRAKKLRIPVIYGVNNKKQTLIDLAAKEKINLAEVLYVGNDLNDYEAMKICGYSACPSNSHPKIKDISQYVLKRNGGSGAVRELVEDILRVNILENIL
tara:strand:- start:97 stop:600 length:504 start_codon:yes stop_codon:yes gene_type:complete